MLIKFRDYYKTIVLTVKNNAINIKTINILRSCFEFYNIYLF
jgi:hypothetical protein